MNLCRLTGQRTAPLNARPEPRGPPRRLQALVRPALGTEHGLQHRQYLQLRGAIEPAQSSEEPGLVHRPDLIQHNMPSLALKRTGNSRRIPSPLRRHRCNDHGLEMAIQLIG